MNAVRARNLSAMADLWGTSKGPASRSMNKEELEQRLTVIRAFLDHETFEVVEPASPRFSPDGRERGLDVRVTRKKCRPLIPFTLVVWERSWLVKAIDLPSAGNPAKSCLDGDAIQPLPR